MGVTKEVKEFKLKEKFKILSNIYFILEKGEDKNGKTASDRSSVISKSKNKRVSY
ncbi:hypothetical protein [Marinitoga sp. 1137]|uniref:hypothetical protein n=1 Tax=Marinitoga sp. 1137 TaxID=1545835 RepID=UPI0012EB1B07|nr:hypothetical protein [Marinitoga sp. 1137]